jgi:hypothetical protein
MSDKLKPCPFCGSSDLAVLLGTATLHDAIKCRPCNLFLPLSVAEWNRRALLAAVESNEADARNKVIEQFSNQRSAVMEGVGVEM